LFISSREKSQIYFQWIRGWGNSLSLNPSPIPIATLPQGRRYPTVVSSEPLWDAVASTGLILLFTPFNQLKSQILGDPLGQLLLELMHSSFQNFAAFLLCCHLSYSLPVLFGAFFILLLPF
jgi:hypothetical protein